MQIGLTKIQEQHAVCLLKQQNRDEIERAIDNAKRSAWDKWFRKEWYKAGARRKGSRKRHNRWVLQPTGRCPAWR